MKISSDQVLAKLAEKEKEFLELFTRGDFTLEIYKPDKLDRQSPHTRDEVYIVASGTGEFINGASKVSFTAGDFLFVKAGVEHRFVDFSDDFSTWVIFFGPEGGIQES